MRAVAALLFTDDNFARNKDWEHVTRSPDQAAGSGRPEVQARHPGRCAAAHRNEGFIGEGDDAPALPLGLSSGSENINPDNLLAAKKRQNKITGVSQDAADLEERTAS